MSTTEKRGGIRVRCPLGGYAPCVDDLCNSGGTTICGLEPDFDFCWHGYDPDSCPECADESEDGVLRDPSFGDADYDDDGRYIGG